MIQNNLNAKGQNCFFVFDNLLGDSNWARQIRRRISQPSSYRYNAFVSGPSGSGKRLIARSLHEHGPRSAKPFIPVDCATLPGILFQGQMFGQMHRETTTLGCVRAADGGTLYLANVDRLSLDQQEDLFHVLETKTVTPVRSNQSFAVDVRVVASSCKNLDEAVREGRFRADLFTRLSVLTFETKSLAERLDDVEKIANHLVAKLTFERGMQMKCLSRDALDLLCAYDWPGNVRELRDSLDNAVCTSEDEIVRAHHLDVELNELRAAWETLADLEAKHIRDTLAISCGDIDRAAALLGIARGELERKLNRMSDES